MNTNLGLALQKFTNKKANKILFKDTYTLNMLSMHISDILDDDYYIDPSILSKALNGKRLLTPVQIEALSAVLELSSNERKYLHECLYKDYCAKYNVEYHTSSQEILAQIIKISNLVAQSFDELYRGNSNSVRLLSEITYADLEKLLLNSNSITDIREIKRLMIKSLYLKGRALANTGVKRNVIEDTLPIIEKITTLSHESELENFQALANTLLSNAYYIAGNYGSSEKHFFKASIASANKALQQYNTMNFTEAIFALRTLFASVSYISDEKSYRVGQRYLNKVDIYNPKINRKKAIMHLYGSFAKASAVLGIKESINIVNKIKPKLNISLTGTGIYEVSEIKNEIELHRILNTGDRKKIETLAKRGMEISRSDGLERHIEIIKELAFG